MGWNEFCRNVRRFTDRAADKINRSADIAALQMKLTMAEKRLDDAYRALGRIAYRHFTEDADHSEAVRAAVSEAERICREIQALREQIASAKKRAAEADAAFAEDSSEAFDGDAGETGTDGSEDAGAAEPENDAGATEKESSFVPEEAAAKSTAEAEEIISGIEEEK